MGAHCLPSNDVQDAGALTPNHLLKLRPDEVSPPGIFSSQDGFV